MQFFDAKDLQLSIPEEQLRPLFRIRPWRHAFSMLLDWLIIIASILVCLAFFNPLTYLLAVITIGARMHALAILMHDATHYRFLKNRKWNDRLTNWLTMYPLFTSIEQYRQNHLAHHRHLNTDHDPDWVAKLGKKTFEFPKTKVDFITTILSYLILYKGISDAIWFLKRFSPSNTQSSENKGNTRSRILFYAILFTTLSLTGTWLYYLLFWVVPYLSTFFMFQYIRSVAEHYGELAYDHLLTSTRSVKATRLEQFFIAPHKVGYHLEHHLYPGVPFYHLPQLHQLLMQEEAYRGKAHITPGYLRGLLNELGEDVAYHEPNSNSINQLGTSLKKIKN